MRVNKPTLHKNPKAELIVIKKKKKNNKKLKKDQLKHATNKR